MVNNARWNAVLVWGSPKPYSTTSMAEEPTSSEAAASTSMPVVTTVSAVPSVCQTGQAPLLRLTSPTPVVGFAPFSDGKIDDDYGVIDLPFNLNLYGETQSRVYVGSNGVSFSCKPGWALSISSMRAS